MRLTKQILYIILVGVLLSACSKPTPNQILAKQILQDTSLQVVDSMARAIIKSGFNAGSGYSQIWARDMNTFIETACEESDPSELRGAILIFFGLQQPNNEMVDGYVLKEDFTWYDDTPYYSDAAPAHVGFKNTVETDQETSLIQLIGKYIERTRDTSLLTDTVAGKTVWQRMNMMIDYLLKERYDEKYGLLYGAMTSDWGDVQPGECFPCDMNECSAKAIDVYDNAMFVIALDYMMEMAPTQEESDRLKAQKEQIAENVRKYLWDENRQKFIPHLYLDKSPIPEGFDENEIYYHGGTTLAMEAGLLSKEEVAEANRRMVENVKASGMPSVGLTMYPAYPDSLFGGSMANPFMYQNGGDWTWFGGRTIQQLVAHGMVAEAYDEMRPMINRVIENNGFYEWYGMGNKPDGSGHFKGSAGTLAKAIEMLREWAKKEAM